MALEPTESEHQVTTLHTMQASMRWRSTGKQARHDYGEIFMREAHDVGFTEVYSDIDILVEEGKKFGYKAYWESKKAETVIALREDLTVIDFDSQLVHPGQKGKAPVSGHSARNATWVQYEFEGNTIFDVEGHWVTNNRTVEREVKRRLMSTTIAGLVTEYGSGNALAFWKGDTNEDDKLDNAGSAVYTPLEENGLISCWDDAKLWPPTHKGKHKSTIDIVGRWKKDKRVSFNKAIVWPSKYSDHFPVSAFYDIRPEVVKPVPVEHTCPMCNAVHTGILL